MKVGFLLVLMASLTACSTMNSDFSCKATAADSCLSIEQVDAMTRFADGAQTKPPYLSNNDNRPIWMAPQKNEKG